MVKYNGTHLLKVCKDPEYSHNIYCMYYLGQKIIIDVYRPGVTPYHYMLMFLVWLNFVYIEHLYTTGY